MRLHTFKFLTSSLFLLGVLFVTLPVFAAKPLDLQHQPASVLRSFFSANSGVKELNQKSDFNHTVHVRMQQVYAGYPVYGANAIMHVPHGDKIAEGDAISSALSLAHDHVTLNGVLYQELEADLKQAPRYIFERPQAKKAQEKAINLYLQKSGHMMSVGQEQESLIVYIDEKQCAHWAFKVSFSANVIGKMPAKPVYIFDAVTLAVYQEWNDIKTATVVSAGGYGGNEKIGKLTYDALANDAPVLNVQRDNQRQICYLANSEVTVRDARQGEAVVQFKCPNKNREHNNVYWDADFDAVNGAYSPGNDALYIGKIVKDMYQKWYGIPVLENQNGNPKMLTMIVHQKMENAYWNGSEMIFGDGENYFYPMVSLGVGAHEIGHGFTEQNSNLAYYGQSGGLNESFSDMAAQAAEYYATGHNNWHIGAEITKAKNTALRYMDEPTKDCLIRQHPGNDCSISRVRDYHFGLDVHYGSGIFNKVFYLLGTANGWNTKKAFDVMVQANSHYWNPTDTFAVAACGVVWATEDYGYDLATVTKAMAAVGINTDKC
ncbi:MAG: M4 family metallopeptidase [Gammaproteobacteria bacterium]|nr:M4 family metallopeptidase [Gammaproteobacteria bacterium]